MEVIIHQKATGKFVASIPIHVIGLNYEPSENEYFAEAWRCAVEDGLIVSGDREEYTFHIHTKKNGP